MVGGVEGRKNSHNRLAWCHPSQGGRVAGIGNDRRSCKSALHARVVRRKVAEILAFLAWLRAGRENFAADLLYLQQTTAPVPNLRLNAGHALGL
jgi:hypothetical protein